MALALIFGGTPEGTAWADSSNPPFAGAIFIDRDIVAASDPSALESVTDAGRGQRRMFDLRVGDWITVEAYLFAARFDDGLKTEIQVNPEFGSTSAARAEAEKYGTAIGQISTVLRAGVETVWIHKGEHPIAGGNNNILITIRIMPKERCRTVSWRRP